MFYFSFNQGQSFYVFFFFFYWIYRVYPRCDSIKSALFDTGDENRFFSLAAPNKKGEREMGRTYLDRSNKMDQYKFEKKIEIVETLL